MTEEDLREKVRHRVKAEFRNRAHAAYMMGMSDSKLSEYLSGKIPCSPCKIREFMGVRRVVTVAYEPCAISVQIQAKADEKSSSGTG